MTVREWLNHAVDQLNKFESAKLEAQVLLAHAMSADRSWILAHPDALVPETANGLLQRRQGSEPLAYILGYREFFGRRFLVGSGVLIPRQETEILVEAALSEIDDGCRSVLDLCTGSGAIGITLKLERADTVVTCSDISPVAIEFSVRNVMVFEADVKIVSSNLFRGISESYDLIVCNPPYIGRGEVLSDEVLQYEPEEALFAGESGLDIYEQLASAARGHLNEAGTLLLEIGYQQSELVRNLFQSQGWQLTLIKVDLLGHDRVLGFRLALP